jgi:hypothetical protein
VPVSVLNRLRRGVLSQLADSVALAQRSRVAAVKELEKQQADPAVPAGVLRWSIKTDRLEHLQAFEPEDWRGVEEVVLDIAGDPLADILKALEGWAPSIGAGKVRMALPVITREWELKELREKIEGLIKAGINRWEASGLAAWSLLSDAGGAGAMGMPGGLTTDWPVYVMNRAAARQILSMGASQFTFSPEDDLENIKQLLGAYGDRAIVVVYQDTPLFVSENCAMASLGGRCGENGACRKSDVALTSGAGEHVRVVQKGCRTVLINKVPLDWSRFVEVLARAGACHVRADFINRRYTPGEVREVWRSLQDGLRSPGWTGNFNRLAR